MSPRGVGEEKRIFQVKVSQQVTVFVIFSVTVS